MYGFLEQHSSLMRIIIWEKSMMISSRECLFVSSILSRDIHPTWPVSSFEEVHSFIHDRYFVHDSKADSRHVLALWFWMEVYQHQMQPLNLSGSQHELSHTAFDATFHWPELQNVAVKAGDISRITLEQGYVPDLQNDRHNEPRIWQCRWFKTLQSWLRLEFNERKWLNKWANTKI
jgi:hypothetical protein